jgi:hypothetical protein
MENPYSPPLSDISEEDGPLETLSSAHWARPRFTTFANFSLLWGFSAGIPLGIIVFLSSLVGAETRLDLGFWHWQGIAAGAIGIVATPIFCFILGGLIAVLFPLFRLAVAVIGGPKLYFRAVDGSKVHFAAIRLRSYLKMSAALGLLFSLFMVVLLIPISRVTDADNIGAVGIPELFHGRLRLVWLAVSLPAFYTVYFAIVGLLAFIPFRIVARFAGSAYLRSSELANVMPASARGSLVRDVDLRIEQLDRGEDRPLDIEAIKTQVRRREEGP